MPMLSWLLWPPHYTSSPSLLPHTLIHCTQKLLMQTHFSSFSASNTLLQVNFLWPSPSRQLKSITVPNCLSSAILFSYQSDFVHQATVFCRCPLHSGLCLLMPCYPSWILYSPWSGCDMLFRAMICFSSTLNTDPSLTLSQILALDWTSQKGILKNWKRESYSCSFCLFWWRVLDIYLFIF